MTRIFNKKSLEPFRRALRLRQTKAETVLWFHLRQTKIGFRRQHSIGPVIADFYWPKENLAIEIDGSCHGSEEAQRKDREKERYMLSEGVRCIRFTNEEVLENPAAVVEAIVAEGDIS